MGNFLYLYAMKYYVVINDMRTGPFTLEEVKQQRLAPDTLVWHKGMPDWKEACSLPELADAIVFDEEPDVPEAAPEEDQEEFYATSIPDEPEPAPSPKRYTYSTPVTPVTPQPKKSKNHIKGWLTLFALIALLITLMLTKPSEADYVDAITRHTTDYILNQLDHNVFAAQPGITGTEKFTARQKVQPLVENGLQITDYFIYNTAQVTINRRTYTVGVGVLGNIFNINTADVARAINALLEAELAKEKQNTVVDTIEEVYTKGLDAAEQLGIEREDIENAVDSVANVAKEKVNELKDKAIEKAKEKGKEAIDEVINELVN